jgi:hypothetical protein
MTNLATTYSADCERLLHALGIEARHVSRVTLDLLPGSLVTITVVQAMTADQLAALAVAAETEAGFSQPIAKRAD